MTETNRASYLIFKMNTPKKAPSIKKTPHKYLKEWRYLKGIGLAGFIGQDVFMGHVVQARDCVKIPEKHRLSYF